MTVDENKEGLLAELGEIQYRIESLRKATGETQMEPATSNQAVAMEAYRDALLRRLGIPKAEHDVCLYYEDSWAVQRVELLEKFIPKGGRGCEIGVFRGSMILPMLRALEPTSLSLVDPWYLIDWDWSEFDPADSLGSIIGRFGDELRSELISIHVMFSHRFFELPYEIDWVYLDASHSYEDTLKEIRLAENFLRPGGIVAGDDVHWRDVDKALDEVLSDPSCTLEALHICGTRGTEEYESHHDRQFVLRKPE